MRTILCYFLLFYCFNLSAQGLDQKVGCALEHIQQGSIQQGIDEIKSAARFNVLAAQYYMGVCYEYGIGMEKNPQEAFFMFRKAAERGLPDAMYRLANLYSKGIGVGKDLSRSSEWLSRYQQKVGQPQLPDLIDLYNEGIKHPVDIISHPETVNKEVLAASEAKPRSNTSLNDASYSYAPIVLQPIVEDNVQNAQPPIPTTPKSDVDIDIPVIGRNKSNTFAVIISNENYQEEAKVEYAIRDGETFSEYCWKTLGIPKENIHFRKDATYNNFKTEINWMEQVAEAYKGKANFIFYYAGHGFPNEDSRSSYLLPVDGNGSIVSTGYSLAELYRQFGDMPSKSIIVFLDACFSGTKRGDGMLASARGIALKVKDEAPTGNVLVFTAANGQQTAFPYKEKGHGLFTYYLLKELKNTKGNTNLGELFDFVSDSVSKQSVVINSKPQTPTMLPSPALDKKWRSLQF